MIELEKGEITVVRAILPDENNNFLLLHRNEQHSNNPGQWELPGGKLEDGETIEECFLREAAEETGQQEADFKFMMVDPRPIERRIMRDEARAGQLYIAYAGLIHYIGDPSNFEIKLKSGEHDRYRWQGRGEAHDNLAITVTSVEAISRYNRFTLGL